MTAEFACASANAEALPDNLIFRSLIRDTTSRAEHRSSALADPCHHCGFPKIPQYLASIQDYLASNSVCRTDCIVLELNNSVRSALAILSLLDAGQSFMAMPVPGQGARDGGLDIPYPRFARWVVTVSANADPADAVLANPATYLQVRANESFQPSCVASAEHDPNLYFKTSGSLGTPKLAVHGYGRFCRNVMNAQEHLRLRPAHRIALPTPIFHLFGLGVGFLGGLAGGASIDFQERGNVLRYLERESEFDPNVAFVTPSFCETLLRVRRSSRAYEFMITGGDRISESTFHLCEAKHGPMLNAYGSTEMGLVAAGELSMTSEMRGATVGRPLRGVEGRIMELPTASSANEQGREAVGELQIRYAAGFKGYVDLDGKPLVPPSSFDGDWYRTGDLVLPGPEGTLQVIGRCDLSVNRSGFLLPFADVENRFKAMEGVEEVAVAAGASNIRGRTLVAFCVLGSRAGHSEAQLRARYADGAPSYSVPDRVRILGALPKLANGKIDRTELAAIAQQMSDVTSQA